MASFDCDHKWKVVRQEYTPADPAMEPPTKREVMMDLLWFSRRKKAITRSFTQITWQCTECDSIKTGTAFGYKPPSN